MRNSATVETSVHRCCERPCGITLRVLQSAAGGARVKATFNQLSKNMQLKLCRTGRNGIFPTTAERLQPTTSGPCFHGARHKIAVHFTLVNRLPGVTPFASRVHHPGRNCSFPCFPSPPPLPLPLPGQLGGDPEPFS